jgi:Xaa-Pro aminopeptidase
MADLATQPTQFAGRTAAEKIKDIQKALGKADAVVLTQSDSVAWTFNLRGFDVPFTPVVGAYAILRAKGKAEIFIAPEKLPEDVKAHLKKIAVTKKPNEIDKALKALGKAKARVLIDPAWTPERLRDVLSRARAEVVTGPDPVSLPKARKNKVEQEGARAAQKRDGVAVSRFICWLEHGSAERRPHRARCCSEAPLLPRGDRRIEATSPSRRSRRRDPMLPFRIITRRRSRTASWARAKSSSSIPAGNIIDGTTDITRTVIVGEPTAEMKDRFTRVLKGMIGLSMIRFPKGTCGSQIDVLARGALWHGGPRLRPRHRAMAWAPISPCTRARAHQQVRPDTARARHDPLQRAGLLQTGRIWHPHREPHDGAGGEARGRRRPQDDGLRDADAGPDRPAAHRQGTAVGRRTPLARRLSRARAEGSGGPPRRRGTGVAEEGVCLLWGEREIRMALIQPVVHLLPRRRGRRRIASSFSRSQNGRRWPKAG